METQSKPLVTIAMTVYNGERYLRQALGALVAQDYGNIEIIILDNISTDRTQEICLAFAQNDQRVRYILDDRLRNVHDAATYISTLSRGEYYMLACDDDLWESNYISKLVSFLNSHKNIGVVYSNGYYIDEDGKKQRLFIRFSQKLRSSANSLMYNFFHFMMFKDVIPIAFGIFRTEVFKAALPFKTFDSTIADVDNLFILKVLSFAKTHALNECLLYYRVYQTRKRWEDPKYGLLPTNKSSLYMAWFQWAHQGKYYIEVARIIMSLSSGYSFKIFAILLTLLIAATQNLIMPIYYYIFRRVST